MSNLLVTNPVITVFGVKGSGKSTWISRYMWEDRTTPFLIYDRLLDPAYSGFKSAEKYTSLELFTDDIEYLSRTQTNKFIFQGDSIDPDEFFQFCYDLGNCVCVYDEIDIVARTNILPEGLRNIVHYGRHKNTGLIAAARRPHNVHRDITSQSDIIILFKTIENRDVEYIKKYAGESYAGMVKTLERGHYLSFPPTSEIEPVLRTGPT